MTVALTVKKWGNSLGVVLPKEMTEKKHIHENDVIEITVVKEADIKHLFGSVKRKMSGQEFKDIVRESW